MDTNKLKIRRINYFLITFFLNDDIDHGVHIIFLTKAGAKVLLFSEILGRINYKKGFNFWKNYVD